MIKLIKFCLYVRPSIKTFFDEEEGVIYPTYKNDASLFKNVLIKLISYVFPTHLCVILWIIRSRLFISGIWSI